VLAGILALALLAGACGGEELAEPDEAAALEPHAPPVEWPQPPDTQLAPEPDPEPEEDVASGPPAPLTGVPSAEEPPDWLERPVLAVKIPNDPGARPQTGLEQADIVFEELTEYGITRFAALFHSRIPDELGNVRSARFVDVDLLVPFTPVLAYSGARREVRAAMSGAGLAAVTEGSAGFVRRSGRRPPHNLYLRPFETLAAAPALPAARPVGWVFTEQVPIGGHPVRGLLEVPMSAGFRTGWRYEEAAGVWRRYQDGRPHELTGEEQIGAANVVVLQVTTAGKDSKGGVIYRLEGAGDALLLRDGQSFAIGWSKAGRDAPLELTGPSARLRPGPSWLLLGTDEVLARVVER
jgi:hypothetical protein